MLLRRRCDRRLEALHRFSDVVFFLKSMDASAPAREPAAEEAERKN
jgi:hypothetical protein